MPVELSLQSRCVKLERRQVQGIGQVLFERDLARRFARLNLFRCSGVFSFDDRLSVEIGRVQVGLKPDELV